MKISLELEQGWTTSDDLRKYLGKLERTLQRICEMEAEAPTDWFFDIEETKDEHIIKLTHL